MTSKYLFLLLLVSVLAGGRSLARTGGPDTFGYTFIDSASPGGPVYEWINLTASSRVILDGSSAGEAASVALPSPVVLYGTVNHSIRVSANGYLGTALSDSGADASNDCPLPAQASSGSGARIYALHDDLDFSGGFGSRVLHEYFPLSPHPHHGCGVNVFTWQNMRHAGGGIGVPTFSFQVLVFDNFDILIQFAPGNPEAGSGSTTGIQNGAATVSGAGGFGASGLGYACDSAGSLPGAAGGGRAVLFEPPSVTVNSNLDSVPATPVATTLREALLDAASGWKIDFDPALAGQTIVRDPAFGDLTVNGKNLAIDAFALASQGNFFLSGDDALPIMKVTAGSHVFLSSVVFNRGLESASGAGGMNLLASASAALHDVSFFRSNGITGGGLRLREGVRAMLSGCNFWANDAGITEGGAIHSGANTTLRINGGVFWDDTAIKGGSIFAATGSVVEITGVVFGYDHAGSAGGSIHAAGTLVVKDSKFDGSSATNGGAILASGTTTLERCSFFANTAVQEGGAVSNSNGTLTVTNCTFGENVSDSLGSGSGLGGAVRGSGSGSTTILHSTFVANSAEAVVSFAGHTLSMGHCLFQDNTANGSPGSLRSLGILMNAGYNLCDHEEAEFGSGTNDLQSTEAGLLPAAAGGGITFSYPFGSTSPARDAGDPTLASPPAIDQRGNARVQGGRIDIGAVEFVGELVVTTNIDEVAEPGLGLSLREAISLADPGSTILFESGLSGTTINLATGQGTQIQIEKDLSIDADALPGGIRISGGNSVRVFEVLGATVSLNNVTLVDGFASNALYSPNTGGGALRLSNSSTVTMNGGAVRRCFADAFGGGVHTAGGSAFVAEGVEFTGNETLSGASGGGAVQVGTACSVTLRKCAVTGNTASVNSGGGLYGQSLSLLELNACTLANNTSKNGGGAIAMENDTFLDMVNTTLSGNEAGVGSTGNVSGGALFALPGASGSILHCTIANNKQRTGAGIEIANNLGSSFSIGHTILSGNSNPSLVLNLNGNTRVTSLGYNLTEDASIGTPANATDRVNRTAYLAPLGNYGGPLATHALLALSPAIDAGDPFIADAPARDARRFARIADGDRSGQATIDIGAFEAKRPYVVSHNLDEMDADGQRSLREAIADAVSGDRIVFNPRLSNMTIDLSGAGGGLGSQLNVASAVQIDATGTLGGVTVSGGDAVRVFVVGAAGSLATHAVNVRDGFAGAGNNGGGFRVLGELLVTHACLEGNRAQLGGGVAVEGAGSARLINVTLSDNGALTAGGGLVLVDDLSRARLEHCTVARNTCSGAGAGGLALGTGSLVLYSSIIAENTTGGNFSIEDAVNYSTQLDSHGYNLTNDAAALVVVAFDGTGDQTSTAPNLFPLIKVGGWAKIHPFLGGSPAKDSGDPVLCGLPVMDTRGVLRIAGGIMDIGAAEFGGDNQDSDNDDLPDWWEQRHGFLPFFNGDAGQDADGDGISNLDEYTGGTDPRRSDAVILTDPQITAFARDALSGDVGLTVATDPGVSYAAYYSTDLQNWTLINSFLGDPGQADTQLLIPGTVYGGTNARRMYFRIGR